jgi:hypothetical protein
MYSGGLGVKADQSEAVRCYRLAADKGFSSSQLSLGLCYLNGKGVPKNPVEAVRLFMMAANQTPIPETANSVPEAQFRLGQCYETGVGVTTDLGKAKKWYRLAAAANYAEASQRLAQLGNN